MFAKVLNNTLIKYPYGFSDLCEENPYTNFDTRVDLCTLYSRTEDAENTGASVVEVIFSTAPTCNLLIEKIVSDNEPILIEGVWILGSSVIALTQDELNASATAI